MIFPRLFLALMALFSLSVSAGQTDRSGTKLVEDFRGAKIFFNQLEIGKRIVALHDPTLLDNLKDFLSSEDRHVRGNAAFVFASLGDSRGLSVIADIIQDTSYRVEGQGQSIAPGDGKYHVEAQIGADRYYAVHLLGELKDVQAIPILVPLLSDTRINYKVAWALGQMGDKSAIPSLVEALKSSDADVRVIAIQSLEHLQAIEALPALRLLLEDNERSHFGALVTVAEAAKAAIATLEKK